MDTGNRLTAVGGRGVGGLDERWRDQAKKYIYHINTSVGITRRKGGGSWVEVSNAGGGGGGKGVGNGNISNSVNNKNKV